MPTICKMSKNQLQGSVYRSNINQVVIDLVLRLSPSLTEIRNVYKLSRCLYHFPSSAFSSTSIACFSFDEKTETLNVLTKNVCDVVFTSDIYTGVKNQGQKSAVHWKKTLQKQQMLIRHLKMRRNPTGGCVLILKTEYIHATFVSKHGEKTARWKYTGS